MVFSAVLCDLCAKSFFQSIGNPDDAVPDQRYVEVDEQAEAFVRELHVSQKLSFVYRSDELNRFNFYYDLVLDDEVGEDTSVNVNLS